MSSLVEFLCKVRHGKDQRLVGRLVLDAMCLLCSGEEVDGRGTICVLCDLAQQRQVSGGVFQPSLAEYERITQNLRSM